MGAILPTLSARGQSHEETIPDPSAFIVVLFRFTTVLGPSESRPLPERRTSLRSRSHEDARPPSQGRDRISNTPGALS
jgi:hypothetical protein